MEANGERSIASVLQSIVGNIEQIVRSEIRLAKTEITDELGKAGQAVALLAGGAILGVFAFGLLLLGSVYLLALVVAHWLAAFIVAVCLGVGAAAVTAKGINQFKRVHPTPEKTIASIKENVEWAKAQNK